MSADRAIWIAPHAIVRQRDPSLERAQWGLFLARIYEKTPRLVSHEPGVVFFEPWLHERVQAFAKAWNVAGGVSGSRSDARLAALRAAAGNVLFIPKRSRHSFLQSCPVELLLEFHVEDQVVERLRLLGLNDLSSLTALTQRQLESQFGDEGSSIYKLLHPRAAPRIALHTPRPIIESIVRLSSAPMNTHALRQPIATLVEHIGERLNERRIQCLSMSITDDATGKEIKWSKLYGSPLCHQASIQRAAKKLLLSAPSHVSSISSLGLAASQLCAPNRLQGALFGTRPSVQRAIRRVEDRYPGSILRATTSPFALFPEERCTIQHWFPPKSRPVQR